MVAKFIQLKKRAKKRCFLFTAVFGVSAALFALGGLLLFFKLNEVDFPWYGYALATVLAGGIVGGLVLFVCYPQTKRFSRRLDEKYHLHERVRTMVEYEGQESPVLSLQRADTEEKLAALPKYKYGVWRILALCLAPILSIGLFVGSFFVAQGETPVGTPPTPPPKEEDITKPSEYAIADLEKLIENVQSSNLSSALKTVNITVLQGLLDDLTADGIVEKVTVSEGMLTILLATTAENSYNAFVTAGKSHERLKLLNVALKESARVYEGLPETNVYDYTTLRDKRPALDEKVAERLTSYAETLKSEISFLAQESEYVDFVNGYITALEGVLADEGVKALADDELMKAALINFKTGLEGTLNAERTGLTAGVLLAGVKDTASGLVDALITNNAQSAGIAVAMGEQAYVYMMKDYVLMGLSKIFGVSVPEIDDGDDVVDPPLGGGGGGGEFIYPSDGLVLDPTDGTYKPYGELLASYYARVLALLEEDDSQASAELKGYILAYFGELHG